MKYLKQILFEMRHQKLMAWVTVSGTALSVFMVMVLFMTNRVKTIEIAPVSHRHSILIGKNIHAAKTDFSTDASSSLHSDMARKIYDGLEGVDIVSYVSVDMEVTDVQAPGRETVDLTTRFTDASFWKIYDYGFLYGKPYDDAEVNSDSPSAVISRTAARRIFGEEDAVGKQFNLRSRTYTVKGVIKDVSPLLEEVSADIYLSAGDTWKETADNCFGDEYLGIFGDTEARLLMSEGADLNSIRSQVQNRYLRAQKEISGASEMDTLIYHGQPYTREEMLGGPMGSNTDPASDDTSRHVTWIIYAVLIILPAINLSSMTRSRLRNRVAEIGVRRAFGASRINIINQMLTENFIITILGGVIGLGLSILFIMTVSHIFIGFVDDGWGTASLDQINARPTFEMLFSWTNFFIALGLCLVLNILSASIPSWRASRVNPAEAISRVK